MGTTGATFVLKVYDGGTYNTLAGQRSTTLNRGTDEADATDKDSSEYHEGLPTIRNWSFDASGIVEEADTALVDLEDAWTNNTKIQVQIETPAGNTYTGEATVTQLNYEGPHDDVLSYSVSLVGSGSLVKA